MRQNKEPYIYTKERNFTFQGKGYPVKSIVRLNNLGRKELRTNLECIQIIGHFIKQENYQYFEGKTEHFWEYQTKWERNNGNLQPCGYRKTNYSPDEIIKEVVMIAPLPGVEEGMMDKKIAKYTHADIVTQWLVCVLICFAALIFKPWSVKFTIWIIAFWVTYLKCEKMHSVYILASIRTFETEYRITKKIVNDLYFNPQNIHVDKPGEIDNSIQKHQHQKQPKYSNALEQYLHEYCQRQKERREKYERQARKGN